VNDIVVCYNILLLQMDILHNVEILL